jgi:hypothetical protein
MYISLDYGHLSPEPQLDTTHNTLHNIIYLLPHTAYIYTEAHDQSVPLQLCRTDEVFR